MINTRYTVAICSFVALLSFGLWWGFANSPTRLDLDIPAGIASRPEPNRNSEILPEPGPIDDTATIQGWAINQHGSPIAGLELTARLIRAIEPGNNLDRRLGSPHTAMTVGSGTFKFVDLPQGKYELRARASSRYSVVAQIVRSGKDPITLLVHERQSVQVSGRVINARGDALTGVNIIPSGGAGDPVVTDGEGRYWLDIITSDNRNRYYIVFWRDEYREVHLNLQVEDPDATELILEDLVLELEGPAARLGGIIMDDHGIPVAGETVHLYSQSLNRRHVAQSDGDGEFIFPEIYSAGDYRLWIHTRGPYLDYSETRLVLPGNDAYLEIFLKKSATGSLKGRMVDTQGNGIPYRSLQLESDDSQAKALTVTGDADGYFRVEGIPLGAFALRSRAAPYLEIAGIVAEGYGEDSIKVVLDVGNGVLEGRIVDSYGNPVVGAQMRVDWFQEHQQQRNRSRRLMATDDNGEFRFEALGLGARLMSVSAPGFQDTEMVLGENDQWVEVPLLSVGE